MSIESWENEGGLVNENDFRGECPLCKEIVVFEQTVAGTFVCNGCGQEFEVQFK